MSSSCAEMKAKTTGGGGGGGGDENTRPCPVWSSPVLTASVICYC